MKRFLFWLRDHHDIVGKIFLFSMVIWLLIMIFPREGKFRYEYQRGKPWQHDDLISPVDFAILKPEAELKLSRKQLCVMPDLISNDFTAWPINR